MLLRCNCSHDNLCGFMCNTIFHLSPRVPHPLNTTICPSIKKETTPVVKSQKEGNKISHVYHFSISAQSQWLLRRTLPNCNASILFACFVTMQLRRLPIAPMDFSLIATKCHNAKNIDTLWVMVRPAEIFLCCWFQTQKYLMFIIFL